MLQRPEFLKLHRARTGSAGTILDGDEAADRDTATERALAAELEKVLAGRSSGVSPGSSRAPPLQPEALPAGRYPDSLYDPEPGEGFDWRAEDALADTDFHGAPADAAAGWVRKARRERRRRQVRHAGAWFVTLAVAIAVVTGAAYLLLGWAPDMTSLVQLGRAVF